MRKRSATKDHVTLVVRVGGQQENFQTLFEFRLAVLQVRELGVGHRAHFGIVVFLQVEQPGFFFLHRTELPEDRHELGQTGMLPRDGDKARAVPDHLGVAQHLLELAETPLDFG